VSWWRTRPFAPSAFTLLIFICVRVCPFLLDFTWTQSESLSCIELNRRQYITDVLFVRLLLRFHFGGLTPWVVEQQNLLSSSLHDESSSLSCMDDMPPHYDFSCSLRGVLAYFDRHDGHASQPSWRLFILHWRHREHSFHLLLPRSSWSQMMRTTDVLERKSWKRTPLTSHEMKE
jgi:hypothetical protein